VAVKGDGASFELDHGHVVIAAITSCTNTSNPSVMVGAGILARNAVARGLRAKPWVKTSLAPGSKVVTEYLNEAGLSPYLDQLRFQTVAYGCTTCIGNSGDLTPALNEAISKNNLVCAAVLSGNRNFEARIHPNIKANFLASPPLAIYEPASQQLLSFFLLPQPPVDLMKGVDLEKAGQLGPAIAEHEQAVGSDPKLAQAHANLIGLYARSGQNEKAEEQYRATVVLNPNLPQSHYDFGVLLLNEARYREAEAAFRKALELDPLLASTYCLLGLTYSCKSLHERAIASARKAVELSDGSALFTALLGDVYASADEDGMKVASTEPTECSGSWHEAEVCVSGES